MQRLVWGATCLLLIIALGSCTAEVNGSSGVAQQGPTNDGGESSSQLPRNRTASRTGPLPDAIATSCVESYSPAALTGRAFAFDGVVMEMGPSVSDRGDDADLKLPGVTFKVNEWFSGGRADTVTVDVQQPTAVTGEAPGYIYDIGSRLLVSGEARWDGSPLEAPIAWGCGFTRYYDPHTAAAWRAALAG